MRTFYLLFGLLLAALPQYARSDVGFQYLHLYGQPEAIRAYWRTSFESGVSYFELWRSQAGSGAFVRVDSVPSRGDDPDGSIYGYTDEPLARGIEYLYFVTAYDLDGSGGVISDTGSEYTAPVDFSVWHYAPACPQGYSLTWTVAYEVDVLDYVITRGSWWTLCEDTIAFFPAIGESDTAVSYEYLDANAAFTTHSYCVAARRTDFSIWSPVWVFIPEPPEPHVSLMSLQVEAEGAFAVVTWSAQWESWLRCYELRRKPMDDTAFVSIADVGPFNSWEPVAYLVADSTVSNLGWYDYRLGYRDAQDVFHGLRDTSYQFVTAEDDSPFLPLDCKVLAYPNPFNPTTNISLSIPQSAQTEIKIFDITGREVEQLYDGTLERGEHNFTFDGANLPTGLYFARVQSGEFIGTQKLLLLK